MSRESYPDWNLCEERLPDHTFPVLLCIDGGSEEDEMWIGERDFFNDRWVVYGYPNNIAKPDVIAWMELPESPSRQDHETDTAD